VLQVPERVVSVKMPASLVHELRDLTRQDHYVDLSEQLRSIVRQKCYKYSAASDVGGDVGALRASIDAQIKAANSQMKKEQILKELARLLQEEAK
jgi:Arc/MetJ-type ribon-helix-helix transcriptional regulator